MQFHELAEIFPLTSGRGFDELVADIEAHGLLEPIRLLDGKILDGRNRYRACQELGLLEIPFVVYHDAETYGGEYSTPVHICPVCDHAYETDTCGNCHQVTYRPASEIEDPVAFVVSLNLRRRHLNESQRAMVAAKLANLSQGARTDLEPSANLQKVSRAEAAEKLSVSERTVNAAKKVQQQATPELCEKVEQGKVSVSAAAAAVSLPKEEQQEIVDQINSGGKPAEIIKAHVANNSEAVVANAS